MLAIRTPTSATVILRGRPYTVANDDYRFERLSAAIETKDEDAALAVVEEADQVINLVCQFGGVKVFGGHVSYQGRHLPTNYLARRILQFNEQGLDITSLAKFLDRAMANPDPRAAQDLFKWCESSNLPIDEDGRIIAYKIVRNDYYDAYTGTFRHQVGDRPAMPRDECDPDPTRTCSSGLHFCAAAYLPHYGPSNQRVMLVAVSPTDVVAFPTDYHLQKARACTYEVIQEIDADTAASFFEDKGAVYTAPVEDPGIRADRTLAEAAGYSVLHVPDADLEYRVVHGDAWINTFAVEAEAWEFAAQHAIEHKRTFYQFRVDRLNTINGLPAESRLADVEAHLGISAPKRAFLQSLKAHLEARLAACEAKS